MFFSHQRNRFYSRSLSLLVLTSFVLQSLCPAALAAQVVPPSVSSTTTLVHVLMPVGLSLNPQNPLEFELLVDQGDHASRITSDGLNEEAMKLIKYFLASLTIAEKDMWVNLSPAEPDRIVPDVFAQTAMGRDMLAQDYVLKQITSSLMNPEGEAGKKFWEKVYDVGAQRAVPLQDMVETFNKVWIIPDKAVVYQNGHQAYVVESRLKVMLEEDYLAVSVQRSADSQNQKTNPNPYSLTANRSDVKDIIRSVILPIIETEVNNGEAFANLRQMYHAMILAYWFKTNLQKSLLGQVYVNKNKVAGVNEDVSGDINHLYQQYVAKFNQGAFDMIREEYDPATQQTIARKYFSGGTDWASLATAYQPTVNPAMIVPLVNNAQLSIQFKVDPAKPQEVDKAMFTGLTISGEFNGFSEIEMAEGKMLVRNPDNPYKLLTMNQNLPTWETLLRYRRVFKETLDDGLIHTPFLLASEDEEEFQIFIKDEGQQQTRSFKPRILAQFLEQLLDPDIRESLRGKTITTGTTGNQGQAVAWMVQEVNKKYDLDLKAVIFAAKDTPDNKIKRMKRYGAEVRIVQGPYEDARDEAIALNAENQNDVIYMTHSGRLSVDSYAASEGLELIGDIIKQAKRKGSLRKNFGYETFLKLRLGLSLHKLNPVQTQKLALMQTELDEALADWIEFVPIGAGGIAVATMAAAKMITPKIKFMGVATENTDASYQSIKAGHVVHISQGDQSDEDGIGVGKIEQLALDLFLEIADGVVIVPRNRIPSGIKAHWEKAGIVSEGASVLPYLASKMMEVKQWMRVNGIKNVACVGTGSNIIPGKWEKITGAKFPDSYDSAMLANTKVDKSKLPPFALREIEKNNRYRKLGYQAKPGMAFILGTGTNGAAINGSDGAINSYDQKLLELGHNLFRDVNGKWHLVDMQGEKYQLQEGEKSFELLFGGPFLAMRFLNEVKSAKDFLKKVKGFPKKYRDNPDLIEETLTAPRPQNKKQALKLDAEKDALTKKIMMAVSTQSFREVNRPSHEVRAFVSRIGFEIGQALGVLIENHLYEDWVKNIILAGGVGENFANPKNDIKKVDFTTHDWFLRNIREGVERHLLSLRKKYDEAYWNHVHEITEGIRRSEIGWHRELYAARLTKEELAKLGAQKDQVYSIGLSIGGTKIGIGLLNAAGEIINEAQVLWHQEGFGESEDIFISKMMEAVWALAKSSGIQRDQIKKIGFAWGTAVDPETGVVGLFKDYYLPFDNYPFKQKLYSEFNVAKDVIVSVINDSWAAAIGEQQSPQGGLRLEQDAAMMDSKIKAKAQVLVRMIERQQEVIQKAIDTGGTNYEKRFALALNKYLKAVKPLVEKKDMDAVEYRALKYAFRDLSAYNDVLGDIKNPGGQDEYEWAIDEVLKEFGFKKHQDIVQRAEDLRWLLIKAKAQVLVRMIERQQEVIQKAIDTGRKNYEQRFALALNKYLKAVKPLVEKKDINAAEYSFIYKALTYAFSDLSAYNDVPDNIKSPREQDEYEWAIDQVLKKFGFKKHQDIVQRAEKLRWLLPAPAKKDLAMLTVQQFMEQLGEIINVEGKQERFDVKQRRLIGFYEAGDVKPSASKTRFIKEVIKASQLRGNSAIKKAAQEILRQVIVKLGLPSGSEDFLIKLYAKQDVDGINAAMMVNIIEMPYQNRDASKLHMSILKRQTQGVIATTVKALQGAGIFSFMSAKQKVSLEEIVNELREGGVIEGEYRSYQYLRAALRILSSMGWLTRTQGKEHNDVTYALTEYGHSMMQWVPLYEEVAAFTDDAIKWIDHQFEHQENADKTWVPDLKDFAERSNAGWKTGLGRTPPLEVQRQLDGYLVGPILLAFTNMGFFDSVNQDLTLNLEDLPIKTDLLLPAFQILRNAGFVELNGTQAKITPTGIFAIKRNMGFGVLVSYYPTYALAEKFLFTDPAKIPRMDGSRELLVKRFLNGTASGQSHKGYFKDAEEGIITAINRRVKKLPKSEDLTVEKPYVLRVSDIGSGDGTWLKLIYQTILEKTDYKALMDAHPGLYKIEMVGVDYYEASRINTAKTLSAADIPHKTIPGDIGKAKEFKAELERNGIHGKIDLVVRSMIDHNRFWNGVNDLEALKSRKALGTGEFGWRGKSLTNAEVEQNLFEHLSAWKAVADEMIVIELHTIDDKVAAVNIHDTLDIPYQAGHAYSDQFIVEEEVFEAVVKEAGWDYAAEPKMYPYQDRPEMTTVSISHLVADSAQLGEAVLRNKIINQSLIPLLNEISKDMAERELDMRKVSDQNKIGREYQTLVRDRFLLPNGKDILWYALAFLDKPQDGFRYARNLVYKNEDQRWFVFFHVLAPGQSTPAHWHGNDGGAHAFAFLSVLQEGVEETKLNFVEKNEKDGALTLHSRQTSKVLANDVAFITSEYPAHIVKNTSGDWVVLIEIYNEPDDIDAIDSPIRVAGTSDQYVPVLMPTDELVYPNILDFAKAKGSLIKKNAITEVPYILTIDENGEPVAVLRGKGDIIQTLKDNNIQVTEQSKFYQLKGGRIVFDPVDNAQLDLLDIKHVVSSVVKTIGNKDTLKVEIELADGSKGHFVQPAGTSSGEDERKTEEDIQKVLKNVGKIHAEVLKRGLSHEQLDEVGQLMLEMEAKDFLGAQATLAYQMALAWAIARSKGKELYEWIRIMAPDLAPAQGEPLKTKIQYNITNGGAHAENEIDMQEFMVVPTGKTLKESNQMSDQIDRELGLIYNALGLQADPDDQGLGEWRGLEGGYSIPDFTKERLQEFYANADQYFIDNLDLVGLAQQKVGLHEFVLNALLAAIKNAGYVPSMSGEVGTVALALDVASSEMYENGRYRFEDRLVSSREWTEILRGWAKKYPIDSIEDAKDQNDWDGWIDLISVIGEDVMLIGDDLLVTQAERLMKLIEKLKQNGFIGEDDKVTKRIGILIKLNQNGFLTTGFKDPAEGYLGTLEVIRLARNYGIEAIISHRSKEALPEDNEVSIADVAAGVDAYGLKSGDHVQRVRGIKEDRLAAITEKKDSVNDSAMVVKTPDEDSKGGRIVFDPAVKTFETMGDAAMLNDEKISQIVGKFFGNNRWNSLALTLQKVDLQKDEFSQNIKKAIQDWSKINGKYILPALVFLLQRHVKKNMSVKIGVFQEWEGYVDFIVSEDTWKQTLSSETNVSFWFFDIAKGIVKLHSSDQNKDFNPGEGVYIRIVRADASVVAGQDSAMVSRPLDRVVAAGDFTKGGIDFDPAAMNFETTGDAAILNVTPQQLQQFIDAPGFTPFIINITPVVSPRIWLGLNAEEGDSPWETGQSPVDEERSSRKTGQSPVEEGNSPRKTRQSPGQAADAVWKDLLSFAVKPEEEISV